MTAQEPEPTVQQRAPRNPEMNEIRERLERREYEVDTKAVAQALLDRLMAGRAVAPAARRRPLV